jgi:uncharacterized membrane protein
MDDIEDIVEAIVDVEEITEEIFEPEELLEDFAVSPVSILFALVTAVAALFTLLMVAALVVLFAFQYGVFPIVAVLAVFGFLVTVLALGGFLYVRTGIPHRIQRKINRTRAEADDDEPEDAAMTEEEAIEELRDRYATGEINEAELEKALDAVITSENPGAVLREYEYEERDMAR